MTSFIKCLWDIEKTFWINIRLDLCEYALCSLGSWIQMSVPDPFLIPNWFEVMLIVYSIHIHMYLAQLPYLSRENDVPRSDLQQTRCISGVCIPQKVSKHKSTLLNSTHFCLYVKTWFWYQELSSQTHRRFVHIKRNFYIM